MELVTVFTTFNPAEAQVIRSRLEAAEIPASVTHETAALTTEGYSMSVGGIDVQVTEDRAAEAKEFLAALSDPTSPAEP